MNPYNPFSKKKILVVGAGISGISVANLLTHCGAMVKISTLDFDHARWGGDIYSVLEPRIDVEMGQHTVEFARGSELLVLSPGIRRSNPLVQWALENGIPITSETECAYYFAKAPIIAVTGSNGKSTTVELIARVLRQAGNGVRLGGNLDIPLSGLVMTEGPVDYYVLEASSFQLEWTCQFCPWIGVLLNISPNHLDHHESFEEYVDAKFNLFARQSVREISVLMRPVFERYGSRLRNLESDRIVLDPADHQGQVFVRDGWIWGRYPQLPEARKMAALRDIRLPGAHNVGNVMVVAAVALRCAVPPEAFREAVRSFTGLAHRIETVRVHEGVRYVDDSKSTSPDATRVAVEAVDAPVILLMGGLQKSDDFADLRPLLHRKVKRLIVFGRCAPMLYRVFSDLVRTICVGSLPEAVTLAHRHAARGDTVLLSPACASFDMFSSYKERGDVFRRAVEGIGKEPAAPAPARKRIRFIEVPG